MKKLIILIAIFSFTKSYCQRGIISTIDQARAGVNGYLDDRVESAQTMAGQAYSQFNTARGLASSAIDFYNSAEALSNSECTPDFSTNGNAVMTSTCRESGACESCYNDAVEHMNTYRMLLARLNCIYQNTKSFTNSAVAFGDNVAGLNAYTGLAWQKQRTNIMNSFNNLKQTYDRKYTEFIKGLKDALMEFNTCENQYGSGDWFAKSGFIYFEFMKERYKRND
ncbi:MAG: hypothetical protein IPP48_16415 [Chitinophagaceae bacterium]|nr:hypothetical protein [Chitinophagaceae bacterium]